MFAPQKPMELNSGNRSFLKALLKPAAEKIAPVLDAFQNIIGTILLSVAVLIVLLLVIDWLIQRRKGPQLKVEKLTEPLRRYEPEPAPEVKSAVKKEQPAAAPPVVKEEIKIETPAVTEEAATVPETKVKLPEEPKWFSLQDDIKSLSAEFNLMAAEKNIALVTELDDRLPEKILGRRSWLNDLLEQLFANALEQTEKGNISIKVKMVRRNDSASVIQFLVTDSGTGIPSPVLAAVQQKDFSFHPGDEKLQAILTRLHSVKWSVEKQGGRLTLASRANEGSTIGMLLEFGS